MSTKLFFVGLNKTATTTIHRFAVGLGFKAWHGPKWATWTHERAHGNLCQYDVFSDIGHRTFTLDDLRFLHDMFPHSKFVLNTRPLFDWLVSCCNHARIKRRVFDADSVISWIGIREEYHQTILRFAEERHITIPTLVIDKNDATAACLAHIFQTSAPMQIGCANSSLALLRRQFHQEADALLRAHQCLVESVLTGLKIPVSQWRSLVTRAES